MNSSKIILVAALLLCVICVYGGCNNGSGSDVSSFTGQGSGNNPDIGSVTVPVPAVIPSPIDAYSHENMVNIYRGDKSKPPYNLSFTMIDYSISSGQPWHGVSSSFSDDQLTIDVNCGRHKSIGPATWFNNWIAKNQAPFIDASDDQHWPPPQAELNFAVSGTLSIDGSNYGICLSQTQVGPWQNGWFLAGAHFTKGGSSKDTVINTPDGHYCIIPGLSDSNHSFSVWENSSK